MRDRFELVGRTLRGSQTESWHSGAAAVTTPEGRLVGSVGDPAARTFTRSTVKAIQAVPLLLAGGRQEFDLDDAELAVICASHAGTPLHTECVEGILEKGAFGVDDLRCGEHEPYDPASAAALRSRGESPSRLHNNCSGKHAGMLLTCRLLGLDPSAYVEPKHPLQRAIFEEVLAISGCSEDMLDSAVDGCGLPTFRLSLAELATAYARLAHPAAGGLSAGRVRALGEVRDAMAASPEMVAGKGRFTTRLMQATGGRVLGKEGAAGLYAVAIRGPVALGVAFKLASGEEQPRDTIVLDILRQLGVLSAGELDDLSEFYAPPLRNHAGLVVGSIRSDVELKEVDDPRDAAIG